MQLETAVMQRLVEIIQSNEALSNPIVNRYQVYRDMVQFRFFESLSNIYPLLEEQLGEALFREAVLAFLAHGATQTLMSDMTREFGMFITSFLDEAEHPYLRDTVWLEQGEADLLLHAQTAQETHFDWDNCYKPSSSILFRTLNYAVYKGEFQTFDEYPLILFYDYFTQCVYFEEITPFAYNLLELLDGRKASDVLNELSRKYKLESEALRPHMELMLREWCQKHIISQKG